MQFIADNLQKILGTLAAIVAAVISYAATGGLNEIITAREIQILGLINVVLATASAGAGFNTTARVRIAEAMETAIKAPPPPQGGYVRPMMLGALMALSFSMVALPTVLSGCSTLQEVQKLPIERQLQLAYNTHAEVTAQVTAALDARQISVGTAKAYLELAEGSRKVLDEARALLPVDLSTAEARLQLAKDILTRAQAELLKREPK